MPTYTEEEWERIRREGHEGTIYGIPFAVIRQLRAAAQARNVSPAELAAEATASAPERDLAEQTLEKLEWLARQGNDPVWKGVHVNYCPVTEEFTYFGPAMLDSDLTRAAVLELLREKGAKEDTMNDKAPVEVQRKE